LNKYILYLSKLELSNICSRRLECVLKGGRDEKRRENWVTVLSAIPDLTG
jgi:hypothetical protein